MQDTLTNAWFYQLKAGNRLLIKKNGGIESAADITSLSKSQIGRCHNDTDPELLPIPAVLRLEAECGEPVITRIMAGLHGRKISEPDSAGPDGECLLRANAELTKLFGEYGANIGIALSDLHVSPAEGARGIKDLQAVRDAIDDAIRILAGTRATGGASIVPIRMGGEG
ncbi:hypothetical protein KYK30_31880 [Shinella yambaruensis]|uniref:Uncharacterized protein n=1 Tax=Shinella yambaruensis TaxID=415996 RepID=A0ABQ5ZQI9_9HYPH|nr:hypothetical protein [Shinella yambaruensis]MCJ8030034.1 hypothetical protein [Shinella yambaruensis]MCU7984326.1 hypothetical protein [Shinella yambaruensis]GLR55154.1 hypothetical protein GCM10007923_63750 [Shinella yambaruensis]